MKKLVSSIIGSSTLLFSPLLILGVFMAASAELAVLSPGKAFAQQRGQRYYRLQLKHRGQYLDADHCTTKVGLNPGSDFEGGACQLWRLVPSG
jgi:hypothetical protein